MQNNTQHKGNTFQVFNCSRQQQLVDNSMRKHRNADNAFQDRLNHKHVDINLDGDQQDGD
eukprot:10487029-Heterocapsa_arctica.AAC.1